MVPTVRETWHRDCISSVSSVESKLPCNTCFNSVSFVQPSKPECQYANSHLPLGSLGFQSRMFSLELPSICLDRFLLQARFQGISWLKYLRGAQFSVFESLQYTSFVYSFLQNLHRPLFSNSLWNMQCPQKHLKAILKGKCLGEQTKKIMGNLEIANLPYSRAVTP